MEYSKCHDYGTKKKEYWVPDGTLTHDLSNGRWILKKQGYLLKFIYMYDTGMSCRLLGSAMSKAQYGDRKRKMVKMEYCLSLTLDKVFWYWNWTHRSHKVRILHHPCHHVLHVWTLHHVLEHIWITGHLLHQRLHGRCLEHAAHGIACLGGSRSLTTENK